MRPLTLRTSVGVVVVETRCGFDPVTERWLSPARIAWGLEPNQRTSPELQKRLCRAAAACGSFAKAAELARAFGHPADDSTIHLQCRRAGERALEAERGRVKASAIPALKEEMRRAALGKTPAKSYSLVIMADGWMARERGADWGLKPLGTKGGRVSWREQKTAVLFRLGDCEGERGARRKVVKKRVVTHQGEPAGLTAKLVAEALRAGWQDALHVFFVADGGVWIWNIKDERFARATGVLDFYHASQHLHALAAALFPKDAEGAARWLSPLLHQLKNGGEAGVLKTLDDLDERLAEATEPQREAIEREQGYFDAHREHVHYAGVAAKGCPIGSGAMESTCAQLQNRFKRTGQFWTTPGKERLLALVTAQANGDWDSLWFHELQQT